MVRCSKLGPQLLNHAPTAEAGNATPHCSDDQASATQPPNCPTPTTQLPNRLTVGGRQGQQGAEPEQQNKLEAVLADGAVNSSEALVAPGKLHDLCAHDASWKIKGCVLNQAGGSDLQVCR